MKNIVELDESDIYFEDVDQEVCWVIEPFIPVPSPMIRSAVRLKGASQQLGSGTHQWTQIRYLYTLIRGMTHIDQ